MKTLDLDPNYESVYGWIGDSYLEIGDYDRAVETYLKAATISGWNPEAIRAMREAYESKGWRGYLQKRVELMEDRAKREYIQPDSIAIFYARLGERDRALEMLEKACDERQFLVTALNISPWWDSLRSDPRFTDLVRRIGFPQ